MASGYQQRIARVAAGLPRYTERERISRTASNLRRKQARTVRNLAWVSAYKIEKGCTDCGYRAHSMALELDHLPGCIKFREVSQMMAWSLDTIKLEIEKCEVVCANCHRVRTFNRMQEKPPASLE